MKAVVELSVPAKSLEMTRLTSKAKPQKQAFADGRTHYWVEGPGPSGSWRRDKRLMGCDG